MIALVQVLIAAVLIPFAFAAPDVNIRESDLTTRSVESFPISPNFSCGVAAGFRCGPGHCCSKHDFCGTTPDHCGYGCQWPFGSCDLFPPGSQLPISPDGKCGTGTGFGCVARKMGVAELRQGIVVLAVSRHSVYVKPSGLPLDSRMSGNS
ncbi:hypothetical protein BASA61_004700 [Batrachochytrium salamandrivorans]|nr:hypothetical protein BASA61_004700 [Batrachochytrium salamandrivorans]